MKQSINQALNTNQDAVIANGAVLRAADATLTTQMVPLTKLVVSKLNVRKHGTKDIASLAASIASKGLLQPLLVRPVDGDYEVVFGARRTLALRKLNAEGRPDTAFVPCIISGLDDAAAIAASLAENMERLPMDELDQYDAFAALIKSGQSEREVASHFGITEQVVKRRLALSRLLPEVKALYREGTVDVRDLQTLTLGSKARQRAFVKECREGNAPGGRYLREWLLGGSELSTKAALFPLEDYKAPVRADLFGEESYFTDAEEFWTRQNACVAALKADLESHGWEVEVVDPQSMFREWQYRKMSKDKGGRAVIEVKANGEVITHKGLVHEDEARKAAKAESGDVGKVEVRKPELSEPLAAYVEGVRHICVRAALCAAPAIALRVAVAQIVAGSTHWRTRVEDRARSVPPLPADADFAANLGHVRGVLGESEDGEDVVRFESARVLAVFKRLCGLTDEDVLAVLAAATAETLAVGTALVDDLGGRLGVDVGQAWAVEPGFLALVRDKDALRGMVGEIAGEDVAAMHLTATGTKLRAIIGGAAKEKAGWVPRWFAFPQAGYSPRPLTKRVKAAA